jgi:hypothetical protein
MNTSASTFLRALATVGVRTVSFRVLSQSDVSKHTTPVAVLDDENGHGCRMPKFSISELFSAYSLTPRKGYYTLEVDHGQLSFVPPKLRPAPKLEEPHASAAEKKRWKPKITRRRLRLKTSRARKFPSA